MRVSGPWTLLQFSFPSLLLPFPSSSNLVGKTEPLHQPIRQWGFQVERGSESLLVISPLLSTRSAVAFQASASLSGQDYIQIHNHWWDFKAPFNGQDNTIKETQLDDRGGFREEKGVRDVCEMMTCQKTCLHAQNTVQIQKPVWLWK